MSPTAERVRGGDETALTLERLVAEHRPGYALQREFQVDPAIYQLELERIWRQSWLFAGHSCQARTPGDYFLFGIDTDSIIIARGEDGRLHAMHNTCRHRGTKVCEAESGHVKRLVCPYHQWSYALDGALLACGGMDREDGIDRRELPLHTVAVEEVAGLVFVNLGQTPSAFDTAREEISSRLAIQGLERAKVVAVRNYEVKANWKLVWENNRECWHCNVSHPEYIKANFDAARLDDPAVREVIAARSEAISERLRDHGIEIDFRDPGLTPFPTADRWWSINRTPLVEGFVTESLDGRPVAPLMGGYPDREVGTLRMRTMPNLWHHSSGDHSMSNRLAPAGPGMTRVQVQWLVDEAAVEGRDYDVERILPFWQRTSEQDWGLCERNHAGVVSSAFTPGPYSRKHEYNVIAFTEWYLREIGRGR
jgi:Rieske 2Fe-2S family protein